MRFTLQSDREITVVFEPTAEEYTLPANGPIAVEWVDGTGEGVVSLEAGVLIVCARSGGYTRAWIKGGSEIYVGPESGPDSVK
ncbi:hypothetical protein Cs7R123_48540 [Catellatospora sp. TT07R-123]|uniref:hypothetical protein n=1 Tax=Catellatospora sp. TT07R-123 TaxID=2733863 RepID=UPI001B049419|nr:hypothetical protein [Catellatospora sp. TT07R-123]GHJ47512.1 hypothetical protein Cs7R123_48540 [Catellatospora sp. TT07R-123]